MTITEAANQAAALLYAKLLEAKPATGLRHRRHARHLKPARAEVADILRHYWARQEAALLREVRARVEQALDSHPAPVKMQEGWVTINGEHVFIADSPEEKSDKANYDRQGRNKSRYDKDAVIAAAKEEISKDTYERYGLRVMTGAKEGERISRLSRVWDDDTPTTAKLPGVSTIEVTSRNVPTALDQMADYRHLGKQLVLVGGDYGASGYDEGEVVIANPIALKVWRY